LLANLDFVGVGVEPIVIFDPLIFTAANIKPVESEVQPDQLYKPVLDC
jgi:hypothetical protein